MKKKTLQRAMAVTLAGAMAMGTFVTVSAEEATGIDSWTAFDENVTLTIPVYDRGVEGVPDVSDNYWTQWIQENFGDKYNITVEFEPITRSDVLTSYALLAAGDDLPTILMEYDYPKLAQWAGDGYLATYDLEEFAKIAPTYYNRMVELDQLSYTEMDGETYFALAERPYYNTTYTYVTFYRQDWLEAIGYSEIPSTWAEQKEMYQAMIDAGLCEHPLGGSMVTGAGVDQNYAYRTFPLDEENWACYGDYAIPALGDEANKKLLQRVNEQYNLGFINPEYYVTDTETAKAGFVNGECFSWGAYISTTMDVLDSFYAANPDGKLAIMIDQNVVDEEGGTVPAYRANNPFGMMIGFSSQATEDEIKAAWMYMEWMTQEDVLFTMQWGIEGENFNYDENGLPVSVADYSGDCTQGYNNSKDYWCVTIESRNAGTIEDVIAASAPSGYPQDFTQQIIDKYYAQVEIAEAGYAVTDCNFAVVLDSVTEYQASLLELYTEYRDQLTMCSTDEFDALYDELAQKYADAGYQEIVDERLAAYEAGQSTKLPE